MTVSEARYQVRLRSPSTGTLDAVLDHWWDLRYEKQVNDAGVMVLKTSAFESKVSSFALDEIVEVWRKYSGGSWYCDFVGLHRGRNSDILSGGRRDFEARQVGLLDLLSRRVVLGYSGTAYTDKSGPAESVLKGFVSEQAVASAIVRVITGLTVQADGALGNTISLAKAWDNLLDLIKENAGDIGDGDIDLTLDSYSGTTFTLSWHADQLGTDRRYGNPGGNPAVVFGITFANVHTIGRVIDRQAEVTSVIVGGRGEGALRATTTRDNAAAIAESPWNRIEMFYNASNVTDTTTLEDEGDAQLERHQPKTELDFDLVQSCGYVYGRDFGLGDLVTVRFGGVNYDKKIVTVKVKVDRRGESIALETADVAL